MSAPGFSLSIDRPDFLAALKDAESEVAQAAVGAMHVTGLETVAYLRSLTNELRPPANPGEGWRRAHPGHWADITSQLAQSYRFEVRAGGRRVLYTREGEAVTVEGGGPQPTDRDPYVLELLNGAEYAAALESKAGYYVLTGIQEKVLRDLEVAAAALGFDVQSPGDDPDPAGRP